MGRPAAAKAWRIIPRPVLESVLNNHVQHHRVQRPILLFHGPRGVGKTSLLHRLLPAWNTAPHLAAYVDFASDDGVSAVASDRSTATATPWGASACLSPAPALGTLRARLERELESLVDRGVRLGTIGSRDVFAALNRWHGLHAALRRVIGHGPRLSPGRHESVAALWAKAVLAFTARIGPGEVDIAEAAPRRYSMEEAAYVREARVALRLAKEVIRMHQEWRREAVRHLNRTGSFSRPLANSATDWPCLLIEILSEAAQIDFFQPKLVINNIDVLRKATSADDDSTVSAAMYHDIFIWRLIALGVNERCLPVILATSDSYYSYQAFIDFGAPDLFNSRETFGWRPQEAKLHMVSDFFSEPEWKVIEEVLGPNPRHLSELHALKGSTHYQELMQNGKSSFEDIVDAYLAYLQVTVVNPAMESALVILQKFASDAHDGKIPEARLFFGAPWRHPPHTDDPVTSSKWAKIQIMDFVLSFANTEFGVNYLADDSLEILDDPSAVALVEVGLLYTQRDPSFIRPISRGIQRCLVRWLVQQKMQMSLQEFLLFLWQRIIRGRSYRHLMKEIGYK